MLADQVCIAFVFRIHGHSGIAGNRFWTGRRDGEPCVWFFGDLNFEMIHETFLRFHFHFFIRKRRLRGRARMVNWCPATQTALAVSFPLLHPKAPFAWPGTSSPCVCRGKCGPSYKGPRTPAAHCERNRDP